MKVIIIMSSILSYIFGDSATEKESKLLDEAEIKTEQKFDEEKFWKKIETVRNEALISLENYYPGKKINISIDSPHHRELEDQMKHFKSGASKSSISLHNFGAAVDFQISIDGEYQEAKTKKTTVPYQILGAHAKEQGLFWGWGFDSGHVAETRFVDQFIEKYPDTANDPALKEWYNMQSDTTRAGYKPLVTKLDSLYGVEEDDRIYIGKHRTIDPLLPSIEVEREEDKKVEDKLMDDWGG